MSAMQTPEGSPFPYQTRNLTPPSHSPVEDAPTNPFDQRKQDLDIERRKADIAKAMAQEAVRWEAGTVQREASRQQAARHLAKVLPFRR